MAPIQIMAQNDEQIKAINDDSFSSAQSNSFSKDKRSEMTYPYSNSHHKNFGFTTQATANK